MKLIVALLVLVMVGLTVLAVVTLPERRSDVPILHWTTDANPARGPQMAAFEKWMTANGYPAVDLELDSNNTGIMKIIIQSASGVGSPIIDVYTGVQLRQYEASGVLMDVTELAKKYGFGPDRTYRAVHEEIIVAGRQYSFPCNVTAWPLTINRALLEREKLPMPKFDWNWDEFLIWCKAVRKIDDKGRTVRFAVIPFGAENLWPTNGASVFNETLTRCVLTAPEAIEATQYYFDLMLVHKVMPTPVDQANAAQGGWGTDIKWLGNEQALALRVGRWGLVTLRKYANFRPDVALLPHKVMPMQFVTSRSAGINRGGADTELAARFLQFLASESYNRLIVGDADALPPNPAMTRGTDFSAPAAWPGEHGAPGRLSAHEGYRVAVTDYGVGREYSPFILPTVVELLVRHYQEGIANEVLTVPEGMRQMTDKINLELSRTVQRDPRLGGRYREALAKQERIDRLKAAGKPVPLEMIDNPVIRKLREAGK